LYDAFVPSTLIESFKGYNMKKTILIVIALFSAVFTFLSCDKDETKPEDIKVERKIQYILYTNKDFSTDEHAITFSVFARDDDRTLLDSAVATMKVKEIPAEANKIVVEKTIITKASTPLVAGFVYQIAGVGVSWYLDSVHAGENNKVIKYAFE
jgi:hypothetical protein